jgi:hypothetical protein
MRDWIKKWSVAWDELYFLSVLSSWNLPFHNLDGYKNLCLFVIVGDITAAAPHPQIIDGR